MTRSLRAHWRPIVCGVVVGLLWVAVVTYVLSVELPPLPLPD